MSDSKVCEMRAIIEVIVRVLIRFRNARQRPVEMLEESFRQLSNHLLFARKEHSGIWCDICGYKIWTLVGCEHGWHCHDVYCAAERISCAFCELCVSFVQH